MKARLKWLGEVAFEAESGMDAVLIGVGACSAFDVVSILKKARQAVSDCVVELEAERAANPPRVFTQVRMRFVVTGRDLRTSAVKRAVNLSAEKYCSATAMLRPGVDIRHEVEIVEE